MVTEAGIIGKIGLNSKGVGVCFNAIRAKGLDKSAIPVHLGLRMALESETAMSAVEKLESIGMASSAHIMIGDATTAIGLEFTSTTFARVPVNEEGFLVHSNHMLLHHENICEPRWLEDSYVRLETMEREISRTERLSKGTFSGLFENEFDFPCSISRASDDKSDIETLFNITIDLERKESVIREGRPTKVGMNPIIILKF